MKKNDKIIVVAGVAILLLASIGIYYWEYQDGSMEIADVEDFFTVTGEMKDLPSAITVSDSCPFYALIATPVAVNYNAEGEQNIIPLYVKNFDEPSTAILRAEEQIGITVNEMIKDPKSVKDVSLEFAEKYWESSEAALIIEYNQEGYNLGVLATPLASYLSIPVIVTEEIDGDVMKTLDDLGVEKTIVCGDFDGYGEVLKLESVDDVVNASIDVVMDKFGEINYVTITNPIDIYEPEVLETKKWSFEGTCPGGSLLPSMVGTTIKNVGTVMGGGVSIGEFTIPDDYKYALVKFEGKANYKDGEDPNLFGSGMNFAVAGNYEIFGSGLGTNYGIPERDPNTGEIIEDKIYSETVVYDLGGETFDVRISRAMLYVSDSADGEVTITVEKLSDPLYPMMKKLSSLAPYLTAYHCGISYGKPEFAFVADDDTRTTLDETCPGYYGPRMNHNLFYASNKHVFDVHDDINEFLGKLADINVNELDGVRHLRDYYYENPIYIALVGGNVVLPQIIYYSYLTPPDNEDFLSLNFGTGTPSDVIYGDIDPIDDDWSNCANDMYSEYPEQENYIGRITGWDTQDVSALLARTVFYSTIIDDLGDWKDKATVQTGCGTDFLMPPFITLVRKVFGRTDPPKWPSGATDLTGDGMAKGVLEPLGFEVLRTYTTESQVKGFTDEAINKIKNANLFSKLFTGTRTIRAITGEGTVKGGEYMQECNFIWQNAHGMPNGYESGDAVTGTVGWKPLTFALTNWISRAAIPGLSAVMNTAMTTLGANYVRNVESLELGPSVMIIESCFCGKIDGMYPKQAISQTPIHNGVNALIASTTESNVPGGYLEPYLERGLKWDKYNIVGRIQAEIDARNGIYPDFHFGHIIYEGFYNNLGDDESVGEALRDARNDYLPRDIDSTFKWVPPLDSSGGTNLAPNVPEHKYMAYYEYQLFGDPAFNPYVPNE